MSEFVQIDGVWINPDAISHVQRADSSVSGGALDKTVIVMRNNAWIYSKLAPEAVVRKLEQRPDA